MSSSSVKRLAVTLMDASTDKDLEVQEQVYSSLCFMGESAPKEVLESCDSYLRQHDKDIIFEWQQAASNVLVAVGRHFINSVMEEILCKFQPGILPHFFTMQTLANLSLANVFGMVPFLNSILGTMLPMLGMAKQDPMKAVFCVALQHFSESIQEYLANLDKAPDPTVRKDIFSSEIFSAYDVLFNNWLQNRESKVKLAVVEALGPMSHLLPNEKFEEQLPRLIPGILSLYKKNVEPFYVTKSLCQILESSISNESRTLEPLLDSLLVTLHAQICSSMDTSTHLQLRNHNEVLRCFTILASRFADHLLSFLLPKLDTSNSKVRVGSLTIIKQVINSSASSMETKKPVILAAVRQILQDTSNRIRRAVVQLISSMAHHGYLEQTGGETLVEYIVRLCCLAPNKLQDKFYLQNSEVEDVTEESVRRISINTLYLISTTVDRITNILWPYLLEFVVPVSFTNAVTPVCKSLVHLGQKKQAEGVEAFLINYNLHVNLPSPHALFARLLVVSASLELNDGRNCAALRLLSVMQMNIHPTLGQCWQQAIPQLLQHLEVAEEKPLQQTDWENQLLQFLCETLQTVVDDGWICQLSLEMTRQLINYNNFPLEKNFLYKSIGTTLGACSNRDVVKAQLQELLTTARYHEDNEREGLASAFGICSVHHLDDTLNKMAEFLKSDIMKKSMGIFNLFRDRNDGDLEKIKSALILCYGYVTVYAPGELVLPRIESDILRNVFLYFHSKVLGIKVEPKDLTLKLCLIRSISMISLAICNSSQAGSFHFSRKAELLSQLMEFIKSEPADELKSPLRHRVLVACTYLIKLEPPLIDTFKSDVMNTCLNSVFSLPPVTNGGLGERHKESLYYETLDALKELLKNILLWNLTPPGLNEMFQIMEPWIKSTKEHKRERAVDITASLLEFYLNKLNVTASAPESEAIHNIGNVASPCDSETLGNVASPCDSETLGNVASPCDSETLGNVASPCDSETLGNVASPCDSETLGNVASPCDSETCDAFSDSSLGEPAYLKDTRLRKKTKCPVATLDSKLRGLESPATGRKKTKCPVATLDSKLRGLESPATGRKKTKCPVATLDSKLRGLESPATGRKKTKCPVATLDSKFRGLESPATGRKKTKCPVATRDSKLRGLESPATGRKKTKCPVATLDSKLRGLESPATGAGIFFVKNKDNSLRPIIDYRELNRRTKKNRYPLPLIPELVERLSKATVYTKLDLRGAYNLIRIREGDEWLTAFRTRYGLYEYLVMPFGLCNAPATFQYFINDIFRDLLDVCLVIYLDDILIYSNNMEDRKKHVLWVLSRLRTHHVYAKLEKCSFHTEEITFLGYKITSSGVKMEDGKIDTILKWPTPTNRKQVQRFLGFANFYRKFIKGFSKIAKPLCRLTGTQTRFLWTPETEKAFNFLKQCFTTAPILRFPDANLQYILEVDASEYALGAILSQRKTPSEPIHPVAFFSRLMTTAEQNYAVGEKELLVIKSALEHWRHLLEGTIYPILIYTDHKNLEYLQSSKTLSARQARWSLFFTRFNFLITYRPGSRNDSIHTLRSLQQDDTTIPKDIQQTDTRGISHVKGKIYIPPDLREEVLHDHHDTPLSGHPGIHRTSELIGRNFWWPNLRHSVDNYIKSCHACTVSKSQKTKPSGYLQSLPIPERPWHTVGMDFIVELPLSNQSNTILVVVDLLTKMAHFIPYKKLPMASETASLFLKHVVSLHGLPSIIVSDRGSQFTSRFWRQLCAVLKINHRYSTAYHPQTNGQTERVNQWIEQYIRCYCSHQQDEWENNIPMAEFAYNNSLNGSTKCSPFYANYGYHPTFHLFPHLNTASPHVDDTANSLSDIFKFLKANIHLAQQNQKRYYDSKRSKPPLYRSGDMVWLSTKHLKLKTPSRKFSQMYIGPYKITNVINENAVTLALPPEIPVHPTFHVTLIKPYVPTRLQSSDQPQPPVVLVEDIYEISSILNSRLHRGQLQYLVKWKGYSSDEDSWEPAANLNASRLVARFHQLRKLGLDVLNELEEAKEVVRKFMTEKGKQIVYVSQDKECEKDESSSKYFLKCIFPSFILKLNFPFLGFAPDHKDELVEKLQTLKPALENPDSSVLFNTCFNIAMIVGKRLPPDQFTSLLFITFEGLSDPDSNCSRAATVMINSLLKDRGSILLAKVPEIIIRVHEQLQESQQEHVKKAAMQTIYILATQHVSAVVCSLLSSPIPFDSEICILWKALASDPPLTSQVLEILLEKLNKDVPYKESKTSMLSSVTGRVATLLPLTTTCGLREILSVPEASPAVQELYPRLFISLLLRVSSMVGVQLPKNLGPSKDKRNSNSSPPTKILDPCSSAIEALKFMLIQGGNEEVTQSMETESCWENMKKEDTHYLGVSSLSSCMVQYAGPKLSVIVKSLQSVLSSVYDNQRITATSFLAELLRNSEVGDLLVLEPLMDNMTSRLKDSNVTVRMLAVRGLGNLASGAPDKVSKHGSQILTSMINAMDDREDPEHVVTQEAMSSMSVLLPFVQEADVRSLLIHTAIRIRPFFDHEKEELRKASILLFGNLSMFSSKDVEEVFFEQILNGLVTLLLHLQDPKSDVVKACKFALQTCAPCMNNQNLADMFLTHLHPDRGLHYGEFMNDVCKHLVQGFPDMISRLIQANITYFKSGWSDIRAAAPMFIGFLMLHMPKEQHKQVDLDHLVSSLIVLLKDPVPIVRVKASETMGRLVRFV
ncbi:maestro heat-like repeat-containing protein family member 1 [Bombina bombina]|uniref:maestro heat-like repeat-containing protein family member 1 n=1 Tax=Bombina bombina TaxID=8345 RepID=UPI00235AC7FD|nr:maestro heat-like repeat-containing protein family member 1 [Bombina bombina]